MIYNNVKDRMKENKKELSKDYRFYLYQLGEEIKEGRISFLMCMIITAISFIFNAAAGILFSVLSAILFIKMLYDVNRFQNIYEREKLKEEIKK